MLEEGTRDSKLRNSRNILVQSIHWLTAWARHFSASNLAWMLASAAILLSNPPFKPSSRYRISWYRRWRWNAITAVTENNRGRCSVPSRRGPSASIPFLSKVVRGSVTSTRTAAASWDVLRWPIASCTGGTTAFWEARNEVSKYSTKMGTWTVRIVLDSSSGHVTSHNAAAKPRATLGRYQERIGRAGVGLGLRGHEKIVIPTLPSGGQDRSLNHWQRSGKNNINKEIDEKGRKDLPTVNTYGPRRDKKRQGNKEGRGTA